MSEMTPEILRKLAAENFFYIGAHRLAPQLLTAATAWDADIRRRAEALWEAAVGYNELAQTLVEAHARIEALERAARAFVAQVEGRSFGREPPLGWAHSSIDAAFKDLVAALAVEERANG